MDGMNKLLGNQVDKSVFTLGDEDDDENLGQKAEAMTSSAADVRSSEDSERYRGHSAGAASENGLTQMSPVEPGSGKEASKPDGAEKQRSAHTVSSHETPVVEKYSGLNGRSEAPPPAKERVPQQAGAGPSSQGPKAQSLAATVETTIGGDDQKAVPSPIAQQLSGVAANSKEGSGALEHSQTDSQTSAALNHESAEPPIAQAVSPEAEEQRIADELAALEAEAEALALQEQQHKTVSHNAGMDLSRYSVSLADESSSADRAMVEAQQVSEQASSGATAMQSALDSFEPRARPFSPPPGSAPLQRFSPIGEFVEPPELQGLLYYDGLDSLGRPVVVINADAVAEEKGARKGAIQYLLHQLEPVVCQGPYILVMVNTGRSHKSNRLQAGWLLSAYRGLSRPFRKNVKYIILVRPSKALKAFLTMLRPFLSRKAHRKVVKVESLSGIADATNNEVTLQHLGARFAAAAGRLVSDDLSLTSPTTLRGASSPTFSSSPH